MSFANPISGKVDNVSTITAAEANAAGVSISRAVDGTGGGDYTPSAAVIGIGGLGIKLNETTGAAANLQLASRAVIRQQSLQGGVDNAFITVWVRAPAPALGWINAVDSAVPLNLALDRLPHGQVLDAVKVRYIGAVSGTHDVNLVGMTLPTVRVFRIDLDGTETALAAATSDPSATKAGFEAAHDIETGSLAHTVNLILYRYVVKVVAERLTWAAGAIVLQNSVRCTVSGMTEY